MQRFVQHKTALCLHRAAQKHRRIGQVATSQRQINLLEKAFEADICGLVDDESQGAALAVLAQVDHAARKRHILHAGHCDEEMVRQIHGRRMVRHRLILR